jgi:acetyl-CoA synthetase
VTTNIGDICRVSPDSGAKHERTALCLIRPDFSVQAFTFGEIDSVANQFANVLDEIGEGQGQTIAILLPKCAEVFYGFLGMLKARSIVLPLFANFGDLALVDRLADCAATCVLTKRSSVARPQGIRAQLPALRTILLIDSDEHLGPGVLSLPARLARASSTYQSRPVERDTPSLLHYTSGSTGKPKGVLQDRRATTYRLIAADPVETCILHLQKRGAHSAKRRLATTTRVSRRPHNDLPTLLA